MNIDPEFRCAWIRDFNLIPSLIKSATHSYLARPLGKTVKGIQLLLLPAGFRVERDLKMGNRESVFM